MAAPLGVLRIRSRPRSIPWSVVLRWAEHNGLSEGEFAMLDRCVLAMEAEYLAWWEAQQR